MSEARRDQPGVFFRVPKAEQRLLRVKLAADDETMQAAMETLLQAYMKGLVNLYELRAATSRLAGADR